MFDRSGILFARSGRLVAAVCGGAALVLTIAAGAAWCQGTSPSSPPNAQLPAQQAAPEPSAPPQGDAAAPASPPAHEENPGLIGEIGKMFGKLPSLKSPSETMDDLNARAKDAARDASDSLSRLTTSSMVSGRVACPVSGNGAPDCKTASDKLCQTKAFKEGKSLTTDSAETCSAKVLIPGRARKPDDCRTDTYVTRALCQ
ncbi:MAG: hypothetical protein ABI192_15330 [Bradyrhizobium sp.]